MFVNEHGKGRRVRCPICNCMFTIENMNDCDTVTTEYAKFTCPDCGTPIRLSLVINSKLDVFVAGKN